MQPIAKTSAAIACCILVSALSFQLLRFRNMDIGERNAPVIPIRLSERIPIRAAGWEVRDEPLGANEALESEVARVLNFDDYVFRIFKSGSREIGVYIAYWSPGRMPLQKVASHTPDRCWTENGWHCNESRHAEVLVSGNLRLVAGQWRRFSPPAKQPEQFVLFWHLVGSRLYDYGERFNARPDLVKWWRDTVQYAFSGSEAQYFIRITSNQPFGEFQQDPLWPELLSALGRLGLRADTNGAPAAF